MRLARRIAAAAASALLVLAPPAGGAAPLPSNTVRVEVTRDAEGWRGDYAFARDARAWVFARSELTRESGKPWRPQAWTIETPGVRIERRGFHDVLVADKGAVPRRVRVRFRPFIEDLRAGYEPALVFSDGPVALFTSQFDVAPLASADMAETIPHDFEASDIAGDPAFVTFRDPEGPVFYAGKRYPLLTLKETPSYVLFGEAHPMETADLSAILDPGLPAWIKTSLGSETPRLLAYYARELGPREGTRPMVMATWAGASKGRVSMGGSVLPGLVIMAFEGEGVLERSDEAHAYFQWFIAHEAAHFWLGQTVDYDRADHAWMMEGGADLLAVRAIAAIDPAYDPRPKLNEAIAQCGALARSKAVNRANERSEQEAYYACGAVFGLVAEAAANRARPGTGFAGFWRRLIEGNRADGVVSQDDWLGALAGLGDPSLAVDIRRMAEQGVADPEAAMRSLFDRAGVAYRIDDEGGLGLP